MRRAAAKGGNLAGPIPGYRNCSSSGTSFLEKGQTHFPSAIAQYEKCQAAVSKLHVAWCLYIGVYLSGREGRLPLVLGRRVLNVVCGYAPNSSSKYPPFLESLEGVQESDPPIVLLGDFNVSMFCYWTSVLLMDYP